MKKLILTIIFCLVWSVAFADMSGYLAAVAKKRVADSGDSYDSDVTMHWKADSTTIDYQATGNSDSDSVTLGGAEFTTGTGGVYGEALDVRVNGSESIASFPASKDNTIDTDSGGVMFWYKYDGSTTLTTSSYFFGGDSNAIGIKYISSTRMDLMYNGQYHHLDHASDDIYDGEWWHIRVTWENSGSSCTAKLYLSGSTTSTDSDVRSIAAYTTYTYPVYVGGSDSTVGADIGGWIDDFIFSDSLTAVHGYSSEGN